VPLLDVYDKIDVEENLRRPAASRRRAVDQTKLEIQRVWPRRLGEAQDAQCEWAQDVDVLAVWRRYEDQKHEHQFWPERKIGRER